MGSTTNLRTSLIMAVFLMAMACTAAGEVIYVDDDASLGGNGQNWATPYRYLQDALGAAVSDDEIRVAEGIYKPDRGGGNAPSDRYATFQLKNGVVITGGYAGFGEPDPDARDIEVYETILSGDLFGNDGPDFANNGENSYNVVTGSGANATAVLDGFTITGGNANVGSDIPAGIVSHWKFDEGQGSIAYDSAGNNHGNVYGAQWTTGQLGGALDFDGFNDYVDCGNNASLDINAEVTITVWVKTNDAGNFQHNPYVTKGDRSYAIKHYMDNSLQFFIYDGEWNVAWFGVDSSFNGFWHHLAGTYDGSSLKLYVDGQLRKTTAHVGSIASSGYSVNIGRNAQNTDRFYDGLIDEVAIYNRALSAGEIQELYSSIGEGRNYGGGMYNESGNPTLINCTFSDNLANYGGGMFNDNSSPTITNCTFSNNSGSAGGGMCNLMSNSTVTNCTFSGNSANSGGGMYNYESSSPTVTNCTFSGNSAINGGGGMDNGWFSSPTLANCILWGNTAPIGPQIHNDGTSWAIVEYSDIQGGWSGAGNINADPLFVDQAIGDYHLLLGSPCIDAGDNSAVPPSVVTDLDGNPRIIDGTVDMGAYEGSHQVFLLSAESVIVPEGGTATFTVMLAADPLETVEVTAAVESGDPDITVESGGLLTFDSTNYSQPQTVTLAAAEDVDELHGSTLILVSAPGVYPASVTAYELDSEGPTVLYVDCYARGANDGSSWENAFTDLREGMSFAAGTFWVREIRVAQGAYSPEGPLPDIRRASNPNPADGATSVSRTADLSWTAGPDATSHDVYFGTTSPPTFAYNQTATTFDPGTMAYYTTYFWRIDEVGAYGTITGTVWSFRTAGGGPSMPPPPPLDRRATFQLINGVIIKGGYAGFYEPDPNARDIELYETILSGDIGIVGNNSDNSYHVVTGSGTYETAVLDGFTITGGNANGSLENRNGGGMYNYSSSPTLNNCIFTGNFAAGEGGAMYNSIQSNPTLTGCTFRANSSINEGGAISNRTSSPTITNCSFIDNSSNYGGGISSWPGSPVVSNSKFSGNSAEFGGGAVFNSDSSSTLTNCIFSNNYAEAWGGAICNLSGIILQDNSGSLAGETNNENSIPLFADYTFSGDSSGYESSVNTLSDSSTIADCTFSGNSAMAGGGVCYIGQSNPSLDNCTFVGNSAIIGGGLVGAMSTMTITNCTFSGNSGEYYGGAFYNESGSATIINCTFSQNTCGLYGGAINEYMSSSSLYNCLFSGNTSSLYGGAMYYWYESSPQMFNCTFAGNTAPNGNAIACSVPGGGGAPPSTVRASNCIFWDGGGEILNDDHSFIMITYSDVQGGWPGAGNINANPLFVDQAIGDYHLLPDSPCINAGDPDYIAEPNEIDLDGKPRVIAGRIDMGAYEFNHTPVADAGPDQLVECACNTNEGTKVTLDGTGSYDADGDPLTFTWTGSFLESPAHGAAPTVTLDSGCPDDYVITLIVNDGIEDSEPNEVLITVVDTTPPDFEFSVTPTMLWPPDHKMVEITPSWTVSDECDATPDVSLVSIIANEGDDTIGDGHTSNDIQIGEDGSIYLRSERSGTGTDRVYTITYQAVDDCGNAAVGSAAVSIPHDFKVLARIAARWLWTNRAGRIPEDLNGDGIVNLKDTAIFANNWIQ